MPTISMCMIVKNEAALLERCLTSYRGLFDEIIIVDTGSEDDTKAIAARFTSHIYDYQWIGDFAAARNFAFSKASCDYIFSADADEVLDDTNRSAFLKLKKALLPEIEIVQMKYVNSSDFNTVYNCRKEYRPKLFKRQRTFTWISPVHETIRLTPVIFDSDIEILHMPSASHAGRDFNIFIQAIHKGTRLEPYVLKMFCKELFISGTDEDFLSAAEVFEKFLFPAYTDGECRKNIACVQARIFRLTGNYNEFFKICLKDMALTPCAEICMELGHYYYDLKDYEEAVLWYINAAQETESIIDIRTSGSLPLSALADCYNALADLAEKQGDSELAAIYCQNRDDYTAQAQAWMLPEEL